MGSHGFFTQYDCGGKENPIPENLNFSEQDATQFPCGDEAFDAVVIANALHIMAYPDKAMREIHRVLKPAGLLFAPTFIHGSGIGFMLHANLLKLVGFRVHSAWTAREFADYIKGFPFSVEDTKQIGGSIAPLLYLAARKG